MRVILEANSRPGLRFDILSSPEFLAEGTAIKDLSNPDRVLIGSLNSPDGRAAARALAEIYENWVAPERIFTTGLWSSELSKLVSGIQAALFALLTGATPTGRKRIACPTHLFDQCHGCDLRSDWR
jgi:UDP-glucose 6-dehydrogenase